MCHILQPLTINWVLQQNFLIHNAFGRGAESGIGQDRIRTSTLDRIRQDIYIKSYPIPSSTAGAHPIQSYKNKKKSMANGQWLKARKKTKNSRLSSLISRLSSFVSRLNDYRLVTCSARSSSASFSRISSPSQSNIGNEMCSPSWKRV